MKAFILFATIVFLFVVISSLIFNYGIRTSDTPISLDRDTSNGIIRALWQDYGLDYKAVNVRKAAVAGYADSTYWFLLSIQQDSIADIKFAFANGPKDMRDKKDIFRWKIVKDEPIEGKFTQKQITPDWWNPESLPGAELYEVELISDMPIDYKFIFSENGEEALLMLWKT